MYIPYEQYVHFAAGAPARAMSLAVRTAGEPASLINAVRSELRRLDPDIPAADLREMTTVVSNSVADRRSARLDRTSSHSSAARG